MNVARLEKSGILQALKKELSDGRPHSGFELAQRIGSTCIATWISHLRHNGYNIQCRQRVVNGRRRASYQMVGQ